VGDGRAPEVTRDGYALPENAGEVSGYYRYEINIDRDQFMTFAKANNATPSILVALLASKAVKKVHPMRRSPSCAALRATCETSLGSRTHTRTA